MQTVSVNVMNLCIPCENRCRYCLLSYDGKVGGVDYKRSELYARRFYEWLQEKRPDRSPTHSVRKNGHPCRMELLRCPA